VKDWEKTLKTSLKQRWKRYRRALRRGQRKFSEKSVHASRVEARRLLSLVELLNVFLGQSHLKKIRRILKGHLNAFDPLRDTQVQLLLLGKHRRQFPEAKSFHQMLVRREQRCLKTAARRLKRIRIGSLQKVFHRLARQLAHVREDAAHRVRHRAAVMNAVRDAFARTVELQRVMDPGAADTIHRTRVAFKRFRYMVEALQPLFAEITPKRIVSMQDFQSMMGEVQDSEVCLARLDKYAHGHQVRAKTLARLRRWLMLRHTGQITDCLKHADRLHQFWPLLKNGPAGRSKVCGPGAAPRWNGF
jgi:CHAD domain-containing protein